MPDSVADQAKRSDGGKSSEGRGTTRTSTTYGIEGLHIDESNVVCADHLEIRLGHDSDAAFHVGVAPAVLARLANVESRHCERMHDLRH